MFNFFRRKREKENNNEKKEQPVAYGFVEENDK